LFDKEAVLLSQSNLYSAEARYPITTNKDVNSSLDNVITKEIKDYVALAKEVGTTPAFSEYNRYVFTANYTLFSYSDIIKSIVFDIYGFAGGAHGFSNVITKTYNLASGKAYSINDVIVDMPKLAQTVRQNIKNELTLRGEIVDEEWINTGTDYSVNSDNFEKFSLSQDTLTIYFPPYQVASYANGTITSSILLKDIQDILKSDFIK
jgi:hypothetical protein